MAKRKTRRVKVYAALQESLREALAFERGEAVNLRTTELPAPPKRPTPREIRRIRRSLNASQARFARLLNVSENAVQSWEQGLRRPQAPVLKLLALARKNPRALLEA